MIKQRFEALDSWRGVCACLVAVGHLATSGYLADLPFSHSSYLFVDFFFVLSGFVIAHSYLSRIASVGIGRFILLRLGRLWPLHIAILVAYVGFELVKLSTGLGDAEDPPFSGANSLHYLFVQSLLLHGVGIYDQLTWNGPSWSISTEFIAYAFFAFGVVYLKKGATWLFAVTSIVSPFLILHLSDRGMDVTYDYGLIRCLMGFSLGVLVRKVFPVWSESFPKKWKATFLEVGAVVAVFVFVSLAGRTDVSVLAPYLFCLVVAIFACEEGALSRFLKCPPMLLLGALSYSIYMVHKFIQARMFNVGSIMESVLGVELIIKMERDGVIVNGFGPSWVVGDFATVLMLALIVGVSMLTYRFIEKPGREWVRQKVGKPKQ